jgi:Cd2+/Zn2+-exporting ATPase
MSVERVVGALPGVSAAAVSFGTGTLSVTPDVSAPSGGEQLARAVTGAVDRAGYTAQVRAGAMPNRIPAVSWWRNRTLLPAAIAAVLWIVAFTFLHALDQRMASTIVFGAAILVGGYPIARSAFSSLRARRLDMNVLMSISVIGAAALGDWSEGTLVVVLFAIGTTLQALTLDRTRGAIRDLLDQAPDEARVVRNGIEMTVAVTDLAVGDLVRVRPGERLPADGKIITGASDISQAAITGESMPVSRGVADRVFAGSINGTGTIVVHVTATASQSMLARMVHLVEEAQASKAPSQQLVDRFAAVYTPVVVTVAGLIAVFGWLLLNEPETWVYRALVLLVIACPCALVISTPVSIVSAIGAATRLGALVKGGAALEDLARVRAIVLDKTGTITVGRPGVVSIEPMAERTANEVLSIAAALETHSEHPIARAIIARALHDGVTAPATTSFEALPGRGAHARIGDSDYAIGGGRLLDDVQLSEEERARFERSAAAHAGQGESALAVIAIEESVARLIGVIAVADRVRSGAADAIAAMRTSGVDSIAMLTGDNAGVADAIGRMVDVDDVHAQLLPDEKARVVRELQARRPVAMVGDGVNDAPALASADVGIAMGIGGSDIALESADIVLMRDDLSVVPTLTRLSHRTLTVIRQNVTVSMATKAAALLLGTLGLVNLWIAVLVDVGTSLLVTANGLRLARIEAEAPSAPPIVEQELQACTCGTSQHEHESHAHDRRAAD